MGRVIGNRFELLEKLGQGGFGTVHLARDLKQSGQVWAVKSLDVSLKDESQATSLRDLFDREQKMLSWLSHPAIVRRNCTVLENGVLYLVMEYVDGQDLRSILKSRPRGLSPVAVVDLAQQVCEVLTYLHGQKPLPIVFRDLKPSNLMMQRDGTMKLVDFGIARLARLGVDAAEPVPISVATLDQDGETEVFDTESVHLASEVFGTRGDTTCMGTPGYAAPEQYPTSGVQTDPRADLYALGAILFQLLTGESPAGKGVPLPSVKGLAVVDAALDALVQKATAPDREQRFSSARMMGRALGDLRARLRDERLADEWKNLLGPHRALPPAPPPSGGLKPPIRAVPPAPPAKAAERPGCLAGWLARVAGALRLRQKG